MQNSYFLVSLSWANTLLILILIYRRTITRDEDHVQKVYRGIPRLLKIQIHPAPTPMLLVFGIYYKSVRYYPFTKNRHPKINGHPVRGVQSF